MPQLVKGGKWVFGWSHLCNGKMRIPQEALSEYGFIGEEKLLVLPGSLKSGGFGLSREDRLTASGMGTSRVIGHARLDEEGCVMIPDEILEELGAGTEANLLVVRGSGLSLGFVAKGTIYDEALKHPELETS